MKTQTNFRMPRMHSWKIILHYCIFICVMGCFCAFVFPSDFAVFDSQLSRNRILFN